MRAVVYSEEQGLPKKLRATLRLRWPEVDLAVVDAVDQLLPDAFGADVVFLAASSPAVVRSLRDAFPGGIICLGPSLSDEQMLDVLDGGADDCLDADYSPAHLVARVGAVLRRVQRSQAREQSVVHCGPLDISPHTHQAHLSGRELRLTPTEFKLLFHLSTASGGTVTAGALQKLIWESEEPLYIESLRKYVQRLRKKLQQVAAADEVDIVAIRGVGYRLAYPA